MDLAVGWLSRDCADPKVVVMQINAGMHTKHSGSKIEGDFIHRGRRVFKFCSVGQSFFFLLKEGCGGVVGLDGKVFDEVYQS